MPRIPPVQGSQGVQGGDQTSSPAESHFQEILEPKLNPENTVPPVDSRAELARLLGGGADSEELVRTVLRDHPLFADLPARLREALVSEVAGKIDPLLLKRDLGRRV